MKPESNADPPSALRDRFLCGARVAIDPLHTVQAVLHVRDGRILDIFPGADAPASADACVLRLKDHLILPGLINVHDHLHFGMFPRLGRGPYPSWREWAADVYHPERDPVRSLLAVPKAERLWAGIVRNLLCGVTTVCHHDASHSFLCDSELPLSVHARFGWAHSLDDVDWRERYRRTPVDWPFIVHCAEGVDSVSRRELGKLARAAELDERIVLVHAVGIPKREWHRLRSAGVWIVWCPTSNRHVLGRTLLRDVVLSHGSMALGSDSPISADGDLIDELRAARDIYDLPSELLYRMVTVRAARLLRLSSFHGSIAKGGPADLLIVRDSGRTPCESLVHLAHEEVAAVIHHGRLVLASDEFARKQNEGVCKGLASTDRKGLQWLIARPKSIARAVSPTSASEDLAELTNE